MSKQFILGCCLLIILFSGLSIGCDQPLNISSDVATKMGEQIWQNECSKKIENLTCWNKGEDFASLGIGHFIWYPSNVSTLFKETFPDFIKFLKEKNVNLPKWLEQTNHCPWNSRETFYKAQDSLEMTELRQLLIDHMDLQIIFMVNRLQRALPQILTSIAADKKQHIILQFYRLARSPAGLYALLDYLNFKGEGLAYGERYQGEGWGLLQVLEQMSGYTQEPIKEFVEAAKHVLTRRVNLSPPERNEKKWLKGWCNRLDTYLNFSI